MARERWINGNQIAYGSGGWFRFVIDREIVGSSISIWWGVETNVSLFDSNNTGSTTLSGNSTPFSNVSFSHSGAAVTWLRSGTYTVARGTSISAAGAVSNLASVSGTSSTGTVTWTNPALPPNQMSAPTVTNIGSSTHTVNWTAPATNGSPITGFRLEWQTAAGTPVTTSDPAASARSLNATGFTPNTQYRVRAYAKSAAGNGVVSGWTYFTQAVAAPSAPTAPTVTRTSDTSHSLAWTRGSQTTGPYSSQEVLRRVRTNGTWGTYSVVATVSASATTYVDTTTVANRVYEYQIRATNASGTATSVASSTVWTTPGVPTGQSAAKNAAANIVVTWSPPASAPDPAGLKYEVSETTDGTNWTVLTTTAAGVLTYTHSSPNAALPHTYRIRAIVNPAGLVGSGLASGYAVTNTVQLLTPPAAPTNLASSPAGTVDRAQAVVLTWQHNPLDSSPQTKYTLQHRAVGAGSWTTVGPITSAVSSYTLPANTYPTGTAFEWQVLTYGLHASPGPYSAVSTVQISSLPGVSISDPTEAEVLGTTTLTVSWSFSDPDGDPQGSWEATLLGPSDEILETRTGSDTASSTTFAYRLDEETYSVRVRVRDSRGLWSSPDTTGFSVAYALPPEPVITAAEWNWKTGTVELALSVPAPGAGEVEPTYIEVWRSIDDGPLERLVTNLPPATLSYLDFTPTVEGKNTYLIQAVSDLPSASQSDSVDVITPEVGDGRPAVWLSGGPGHTRVGRLATEVSVEARAVRERLLQRYEGRPLPVEHSGEHVDETWQVGGNLNTRWSKDVDAPESPEDWRVLGSLEGPHLLRAPALFGGQPIYAHVSIDGPTVARQTGGNVHKVSFTATRAEG